MFSESIILITHLATMEQPCQAGKCPICTRTSWDYALAIDTNATAAVQSESSAAVAASCADSDSCILTTMIEGMPGCAPAAMVGRAAEAPLHCFADCHILILDVHRIADCLQAPTPAELPACA